MRRIVCAAIRNNSGKIICGPRHFDLVMRKQIEDSMANWKRAEQGFVNQAGEFLTREEAFVVATEAGQIFRRCGGDECRLFSENLY